MKAADRRFRSRRRSDVPKVPAFHLSAKKALARAVAAAIFIFTAPTAPLFAQPITEIIDSTGDGTHALSRPQGVAVDSADNVYVVSAASPGDADAAGVFKITPDGTITRIIDTTDGLFLPRAVAVDSANNVYVTSHADRASGDEPPFDKVSRITPSGTITEIIDDGGDGTNRLGFPVAVAVDSADNVYVAGAGSSNVFKITPGGAITQIIDSTGDGTNGFGVPTAVAVDSAGNVYVPDALLGEPPNPGSVFKITPDAAITQIIDTFGDGANRLYSPGGVAVDSADNVYVAGAGSGNVFKITPGGTITQIIDSIGDGTNSLDNPGGVAVDSADNVYVTGVGSGNVFKITPGGTITEIIDSTGDGTNPLDGAVGVAVDSADNVYVTGEASDNAFKIVLAQTLCTGDCDRNGKVTIGELITGVNIALGRFSVGDCRAFDRNSDDLVSINELIQAVNRALYGCFAVDCAALEGAVDRRWGDAPDVETRLEHFDSLWAHIGSTYAGFPTLPSLDWDEVRDTYRSKFESAETYGRFFTLTADLMQLVHDVHTVIWSKKVCDTPRSERPPLFARYDYPRWASSRTWRASESGLFGVCGTPLDDDRLLVYQVEPDNPADLAPGDLILGYDGVPWRELATALEACDIPICGYHRAATAADDRLLMSAVMFNAHLFERLDVQRYGSTEIESIPTDELLAYKSTLECSEQIAPDGVELPWTDIEVTPDADIVSWGRLEGNIGYIYAFAWGAGGAGLFDAAVADLMDTEGLVIDMRNHSGGGPTVGGGTALLFGEDVPSVLRPHVRPPDSDYDILEPFGLPVSVVADPATFYSRPIAILTGPKTQSGGDVSSLVYSKHPRARRFGRATSGDFGGPGIGGLYTPVAGVADDFVGFWYALPSLTTYVYFDSEGQIMLRSEQTPETEVWFTQDDVAAGRDTVVETALAWIAEENGL